MSDTKWKKENMVAYTFRFTKKRDNDLIEWINSQENKADYIRQLIIADMERQKKNER